MSDKNLSGNEFEELLSVSIGDAPPESVINDVTPWKMAMSRVVAGLALCTITLNFLGLNYILPAIGVVLMLLGFRSLRRENGWFMTCYVISIIRTATVFVSLILNTVTTARVEIPSPRVDEILTVSVLILNFVLFFCLWRGILAVQRKSSEAEPKAKGAGALMVWYVIMCLLALWQYQGIIIMVLMLISYIFIIRSLIKTYNTLNETGYMIAAAPVKLSDKWICLGIAAVTVVGCICGYVFFNSYDMDWSEVDPNEHSTLEETKQQLLTLGFPEDVLNDLTAEDIAACEGAVQVVVDKSSEQFGLIDESEDEFYNKNRLAITGIGVQLSNERETWMIFHHFRWTGQATFYGTESLQIWTTARDVSEGWTDTGYLSGRVLYDDGKSYAAPFHFLGKQSFSHDTMFWGTRESTDIFAAFSIPNGVQARRGYVAYEVAELEDGYIISSWINYTHQLSWFQYPAKTAMEARIESPWIGKNGAFSTVQDALQFYPHDGDIEMIS